jgi:hypothetical protein
MTVGLNETEKAKRKAYVKQRLRHVFEQVAHKAFYDLNHANADFCIQMLRYPNGRYLSKLLKKLRSCSEEWIVEFIRLDGLFELMNCIDQVLKKGTTIINSIVVVRCVNCIKATMNFKFGFKSIIETCANNASYRSIIGNGDYKVLLVLSRKKLNIPVFYEACCGQTMEIVKEAIYELLSGMCAYSSDGYSLCASVLKIIQVIEINDLVLKQFYDFGFV